MAHLTLALSVGGYPAPCFGGCGAEEEHRRFLRQLATLGKIRLLDSTGSPLNLKAAMNGAVHYRHWYVDQHDAQVITEALEAETKRVEAQTKKRQEEEAQKQEQAKKEREERQRERKKRVAELKAAGLWNHPVYKTLKAARADGWHEPKSNEYDGEEIAFKGHTLVRNTKLREPEPWVKRYVYKATLNKVYGLTPGMIAELDPPDKTCENPHYAYGPEACLYLIERVEAWIEANKERVEKARADRGRRSEAMKAALRKKNAERLRQAEERLEAATEWVRSLPIVVRQPLPGSVLDDAKKRRPNNFVGHADPLKERALHSYVRHRLTNYEKLLQELYAQEFSFRLYPLLRERVDAAVRAALVEWQRCEQDRHQ